MKILYVIGSMQVGGAESHLQRIASDLVRDEFDVTVFAFQSEGPLRPAFEAAGVCVVGGKSSGGRSIIIRLLVLLKVIVNLLWILARLRPDVVHFFLPMSYIVGGILSLPFLRTRKVMSRRSMNYYQKKYPFFATVERFLHHWMDAVLGNSQAVIEQLKQEGVPESKLHLIYNGIDVSNYALPRSRDALAAEFGIAEDAFVMVIVANLIPYKGHADLLLALGHVKEQLPRDWHILVVGRDDGILASLEQLAEQQGIRQRVHFLGQRRDIPVLLNGSDMGVLCSHEEGFSNAILEAMAASLPLVVTDVGGNAEAVLDGVCGRVVPPKDPIRLGKAISELANNPERLSMGMASKSRVVELFSSKACLNNYKKLYKSIINT